LNTSEPAQHALDEAAAAVLAADEAAARAVYRERYFPLALDAMSKEAEPAHVLVVTCGTQEYSIALSLRRTPARIVYFVHTDQSRASAEAAIRLAGLTIEPRYRQVGKADSKGVYEVVRDAVREHDPKRVTIDITSGTKAMTAAASSVAGHLRLRQIYIESQPLRPGLFGRERAHVVDHPLVALGETAREVAEDAFDVGAFDRARAIFQELDEARVPGYHFGARAVLCDAYHAWEGLRFDDAARHLGEVHRLLEGAPRANLPREGLIRHVGRVARQRDLALVLAKATRNDGCAADKEQAHALLRYLVSQARRKQDRHPDLASLLAYRAVELVLQRRLATRGIDASHVDAALLPGDFVARYNALCDDDEHKLVTAPTRLALAQSYTTLRVLGDQITEVAKNHKELLGKIKARNKSVYAHGFRSLETKEACGFLEVATRYVQKTVQLDHEVLANPDPDFDLLQLRGANA
jgi:CRISPR-associated protein (TIGR02710 family)